MMLTELTDWLDEVSGPSYVWFVKRLSGNDTLANGSHQAGPYIPKRFLFDIFPSLNRPDSLNPEKWFDLYIDSHADGRKVRAIWYNNKFHGTQNGRNEARITRFGGHASPLLDPESTGSLVIFAFLLDQNGEGESCRVWVCRHETEEDLVEDRIGPVEPATWKIWAVNDGDGHGIFYEVLAEKPQSCWLEYCEIPEAWLTKFPSGLEIIEKTVALRPLGGINPDVRLMKRRVCEFELFKSVEEAVELPHIKEAFSSIDDFIAKAQSILQRRKSRSGRSLELHAKYIFKEEGLAEDEDFSHQPESEAGKRPDFLFPSESCYKSTSFPDDRLRMLAVKTTCKDRWRQILNEAERVEVKHLLTLQEGISENQFKEMTNANVRLVVPEPLKGVFPKSVQPHLQSFESFIGDIRLLKL